jgi:hypothetical protein
MEGEFQTEIRGLEVVKLCHLYFYQSTNEKETQKENVTGDSLINDNYLLYILKIKTPKNTKIYTKKHLV